MPAFSYQYIAALKALVALAATALLLWSGSTRTPGSRRLHRADQILAVLGALSFLAWWNFGSSFVGAGRVHYYEFFHYYLGSKYSTELGYTGLYDCVAAAEVEQGRVEEVAGRWIRDLTTNDLRQGSPVIDDPALCRSRFSSDARWDEFKHDVEWFRARIGKERWLLAQMDHGYNATPVWTVVGRWLSNSGPVSTRKIAVLWSLDPLLLLAMWATVWWAFGWRVMCVALVWWGTNYPARYNFIGGAFLRQDWLFLAVAGICLARRGRMAVSGFAITWASLLRIFPGFIVVGLILKVVSDAWRNKSLRVDPSHWHFFAGALIASILLLPFSFSVGARGSGPFSAWTGFIQNSEKLMSTPLTNHVGLPVVVAFDPKNRSKLVEKYWLDAPWDTWKEGRRRVFHERRAIYWALVVAFVVLLGFAVQRQPDWSALVLGIGLIPFCTELTCYYYGILLGLAFLWPRYPIAGVGLTATALLSGLITAILSAGDDRYTVISLLIVLLVALVTATVARHRRDVHNDNALPGLVPSQTPSGA